MTEPRPPGVTSVARVLGIDFEDDLLATSVIWESLVDLLRTRPWDAPRVMVWLADGRDGLCQKLATTTVLNPEVLPYRREVLTLLKASRDEGDRTVLVTSAHHEVLAQAVAKHLGLFDEVLVVDSSGNLTGLARLEAWKARFDAGEIRFAGASAIERPKAHIADWIKLVRVHQWSKNVLLFVPLITSHRLTQIPQILACLLAFCAFCASASAIYLLNDLIDLPTDRLDARKRRRPMASGAIGIPSGLAAAMILLMTSLGLATCVSVPFLVSLLVYLLASMSYTLILKRKMLIDVICLASLYTLRILAGGAATGIEISSWLMAFAMFLFLSLAFLKRYTELAGVITTKQSPWLPGRGYQALDLDMIRSVGPASGYIAVLVVCLYVNDQQSVLLYRHPRWLWLLCPVMLYWISRVWFLAQRGQMDSDPVVFALRDRISLLAGLLVAIIIAAATLL